ncbi:hypothetical protein HW555_011408 [Spodoptera exigua]|uniref:Uncharacterized protein n=1 Tax=Spodoptera exigua TaxID=7107 RepID=A0A835L005_SPOEX|nr:hypothetical protein HW555_011408 [Spodoptera exigua]
MFVEYLQSDKYKKHGIELDHGHHGKCGRMFGKHGHGKLHGHGKHHGHGMHHGHHGPHGHHGHHGPHRHGRSHCHRGRHGLHGPHKGKFWARWTIDLTTDESDNNTNNTIESGRNPSPPPNETQEQQQGTNKEKQNDKNKCDCKCSRKGRYGGRFGHGKCHKQNKQSVPESNTTESPANAEEPQANLTEMVENINIENSE